MPDMLDLLYPLSRFYDEQGIQCPVVERVENEAIPEPFRELLVHQNDMTPTLEAFHGATLELQVLRRTLERNELAREVVLRCEADGRATEFGAIIIQLDNYPEGAQHDIIDGHLPLGTILAKHSVEHESCPQAFIRVWADTIIISAFGIPDVAQWLYGRRNRLITLDGNILADILEILPPG